MTIPSTAERDALLAGLAAPFFAARPKARAVALGCAEVRAGLDLAPFGQRVAFEDAAHASELVARYHAVNLARFGGPVALPGWVLADLYLMPAAITLLLEDDAILAAYYAAPTVIPGEVVGVSLLATVEGTGAGTAAKALGLGVLRAKVARGITQWTSRAVRVHARFGDLRVEGPAPAVHGLAAQSFRYRTVLAALAEPLGARLSVEEAAARTSRGEPVVIRDGTPFASRDQGPT